MHHDNNKQIKRITGLFSIHSTKQPFVPGHLGVHLERRLPRRVLDSGTNSRNHAVLYPLPCVYAKITGLQPGDLALVTPH